MANNSTNITTTAQLGSESQLQKGDVGVLMTSCVIGVIANFFVTYLISTVRRLKTVTNVFVFSICLCNVLVSAVLLPMEVFMGDPPEQVYYLVYRFINLITILIYICNLTAVSYDRLLSITQPMLYTLKQPRRRAIIIVFFMWVIPIIYSLLPLFWIFNLREIVGNIYYTIHRVYLTTTLVVFLLGPLFYIIYVYFRVCMEMKKMSTLKTKIMTPIQKKFFRRQKRKSSMFSMLRNLPANILHQMRNGYPSKEGKDENSISSPPTSIKDFGITCKPVTQAVIETSTLEEEKLGMLAEYDDPKIITMKGTYETQDKSNDPISRKSNNRSNEKVSVVTFNGIPNSFHTEKYSVSDEGSYPKLKRTSTRNSIFSNVRTSLSPLNRKRQSSISRMKHKAQELKASFAFLISAITYMFTWLPVVALNFDDVLERNVLPESLATMSLYAIAINALTDPFLYALLLPNFRKTLTIMLQRFKLDW